MEIFRTYLDSRHKLVGEVVDWLVADGRIRTSPEGAKSLAHILVVVPTAQSARNLKLGLARKAAEKGRGGILPPLILMPNEVLVPADERIATEAEELAAMASVLSDCDLGKYAALFPKPPAERTIDWSLAMADSLLGIESVLGEKAITMSEVKCEADAERWRDLGAIEKLFFKELESKKVLPRILARRAAVKAGCRFEGIEEIVLPATVDIQEALIEYLGNSDQKISVLIHADKKDAEKFDEWGRPRGKPSALRSAVSGFAAEIDPVQIDSAPTAVVEADDIAKFFHEVKKDEAFPALAVCDSEMYPELEGAFQNYFADEELVLRNPSKSALANSSLGRLLVAIIELAAKGDYETFSTFVRTGDVARWARGALTVDSTMIARFVGALDAVQNKHLPRTFEEVIAGAEAEAQSAFHEFERINAAGLARLARAVKAELKDPFQFIRRIFSSVKLDEKNPADRELIAAAESVRDLRSACASELIPEKFRRALFTRMLKSASYMLEPTAENVLATTGWLEVPWCPEDEIVIAGFNEGCVPENIVGHPFLPDSLREELGITTNARRECRDAFIFAEALKCRAPGAVSVHLHQISADKNVMKPSRILFNAVDDKALPALALRLYAVTKGNDGAPAKELPSAWRLKLPLPPKEITFKESISPTDLDQYRRCPFGYYLQETFGAHADDRNQELDAMAFGTLCHEALDQFAKKGPKDSVDADEIAAFLEDEIRRQLSVFGANLPAIIELQGEAAIARLKAFSVQQAARRRAGWRIIASEQKFECTIKGCPTRLRGKVDRIDEHEKTGELAIIDYKTWSRAKKENYESLQLPIYRAMVETSKLYDPVKAHNSRALYCILAERAEDVKFDEEHAYHEGGQSAAEDKIVALLTGIAKGIFYPPSKDSTWEKDYGALIWESPEKGIDPAWIKDQQSRKEAQ